MREKRETRLAVAFFRLARARNRLFIQGSFEIIELTHLSDGEGRNAKRSRGKIPAAPDEPFLPSNSTVITLEQMGSPSFHFSLQVQQQRLQGQFKLSGGKADPSSPTKPPRCVGLPGSFSSMPWHQTAEMMVIGNRFIHNLEEGL